MSKDAYYFPHDSNAKDDPKCVLLIEQLGMEGYGIYWMLIETLRDQPGYKYPLSLLPALARRYNTTPEKVKTVVHNYGLFMVEADNIFFSQSLIKRMIPMEDKRRKLSEAGRKGNAARWGLATQSHGDYNCIATQSQVKESTIDKSTGEENKEISICEAMASQTERESFYKIFFFKNFLNPIEEVERFCANYEAAGWVRKNGTKAVDRIALARTWTQLNPNQPPRFPTAFLDAWKILYADAIKHYPDQANTLIHSLKAVEVNSDSLCLIIQGNAIQSLIEGNIGYFKRFFSKYFEGKKLRYRIVQDKI